MKQFKNHHTAFTMIELVMVIVVLGILASLAMPRLDRDTTQEASDIVLSNIRYTQHLALMDYKHDFDTPAWQQRLWKIDFASCSGSTGFFMRVGSDMDNGGAIGKEEAALDPITGKPLYWITSSECSKGGDETVSQNVFLSYRFGVEDITATGGCNQHIAFDHLGRPHVGILTATTPTYATYMDTTCTLTFTMSSGDTFAIKIEPETGYAYIDGQEES
ncbi:MAG: type II secretion system protein [Campylobacterota bacterium]|nr:type II secretion system protein [Campylobacterota bacterium]